MDWKKQQKTENTRGNSKNQKMNIYQARTPWTKYKTQHYMHLSSFNKHF